MDRHGSFAGLVSAPESRSTNHVLYREKHLTFHHTVIILTKRVITDNDRKISNVTAMPIKSEESRKLVWYVR